MSSRKFRVNANKRRFDVWLVYRCAQCDGTFNLPVHERASARDIGARLAAYEHNDEALAELCACDARLLAQAGAEVVSPASFRVERPPVAPPAEILISMPLPICVRLDRLIAAELGWCREEPALRAADGRLVVVHAPSTARALRRPARNGQRIRLLGLEHPVDGTTNGCDFPRPIPSRPPVADLPLALHAPPEGVGLGLTRAGQGKLSCSAKRYSYSI